MKLVQLAGLIWLAVASYDAVAAGLNIALTNDDGWDAVGEAAQADMRPEPDTQPDIADADTIAFSSGYISNVPIQADYTADDYESYADLLDRK